MWLKYVLAPIVSYLGDLPDGSSLSLTIALSSDIPLGGGLSSSASLMVCVGKFLETVFDGCGEGNILYDGEGLGGAEGELGAKRALRAKKSENGSYVNSPCGIMDQFIISTAVKNHLCLIKCGGDVGGKIVEVSLE